MSETHPAPQSSIHWPSVWQFALSLFGILVLWGISLALLLMVLGSALMGDIVSATALVLNAAGTAFAGVLLIPSARYSLFRLLDKPVPIHIHLRHPGWVILALPPVLLLGYWAAGFDATSLLLLPVLHVVAAGISVGWLLALGLRGLSVGPPQLAWGIFGMGLVVAPFLSLIAEFVALLGFGMLYLILNPDLLEMILNLSESMPLDSPGSLLDQLEPYLMQPSTVVVALLFGALIVPLVEELFKPVGVWLLVKRKPSPGQGFAAGLLSGAGYALFENFSLGAAAGEDWAMVVVARIGTSLIHIVTTGLTGWALSLAWTQKRYLRLALSYLAAVSIHALWNGTVIITAVSELFGSDVILPDFVYAISAGAPIIFGVLILGCSALLLGFNASLRRAIIPPAQPQPVIEDHPEKEIANDGSYYHSD
ncbi:PrsW family glutamic-type intramembrane protease [Chloroflexota bacterium]